MSRKQEKGKESKPQEKKQEVEEKEEAIPKLQVDLGSLYSENAILDEKTGKTIAEKNSTKQIYPWSLTKIMTVLVGAENLKDLQKEVTIPAEIQGALIENHVSVAGFEMGEKVKSRRFALWSYSSGADCCMTIAREVAGTEEEYLKLMNKKAEELGLKHTHFADVSGFHHEDNYSTVEDLAKLLREALQNKGFYKVFTTDTYTTTATKIISGWH